MCTLTDFAVRRLNKVLNLLFLNSVQWNRIAVTRRINLCTTEFGETEFGVIEIGTQHRIWGKRI